MTLKSQEVRKEGGDTDMDHRVKEPKRGLSGFLQQLKPRSTFSSVSRDSFKWIFRDQPSSTDGRVPSGEETH